MQVPAQGPIFDINMDEHGVFKARARDMETMFRIEWRTDQAMRDRDIDPNSASIVTRQVFQYMAIMTETCEQQPPGFDIGEIQRLDPNDAMSFYVRYAARLSEQERIFRRGVQEVGKNGTEPSDPSEAVQGSQDNAVGSATA